MNVQGTAYATCAESTAQPSNYYDYYYFTVNELGARGIVFSGQVCGKRSFRYGKVRTLGRPLFVRTDGLKITQCASNVCSASMTPRYDTESREGHVPGPSQSASLALAQPHP